jgi:hypothetical protein
MSAKAGDFILESWDQPSRFVPLEMMDTRDHLPDRALMPSTENTKKRRAIAELVAFALISKQMMDYFFGSYSGPASLITTLILLTIYMHRRGEKWASLGLRALPGAKTKLLLLPQALLIFVSVLGTSGT